MMNISITNEIKEAKAITHAGVFHADEVFAAIILAKALGDLKVARVFQVPTDEVTQDHIIFDIGLGELDHHQKGGNGRRENGVPYAACGLVFRKYGRKLFAGVKNAEIAFQLLDKKLIAGIDAYDNGEYPKVAYPISNMNISQLVKGFHNPQDMDTAFVKACEFFEVIFDNTFNMCCKMAEDYPYLQERIAGATDGVMVLDHYVDWSESLFEIPGSEDILFAVYPSIRGGYNWQCVPVEAGSFAQRKPVPSTWWGKNAEELQNASGVKSAIFCHKNGFIGSCATLEDAIQMAKLAAEA